MAYLRAENQVLRSKIEGRVRCTREERSRLASLGKGLGSAAKDLVSIVTPRTFSRWVQELNGPKQAARRPGRPRTSLGTRKLILKMAAETDWGYVRIMSEVRKLGVKVSKGTVANILKEHGVPTGPARGEGTWDRFIAAHAKTLWACDFLRKRVVTAKGLQDAFTLVFINLRTRLAYVTPSTTAPDAAWVKEQAGAFVAKHQGTGVAPAVLIRDRDTKYTPGFTGELRRAGVKTVTTQVRAPNMNAHCERLIQSVQEECLDRFIPLGTRHLDYLLKEYVEHYNTERPHMALGHAPLAERALAPPKAAPPAGRVRCRQRLGGVLRHYYRAA